MTNETKLIDLIRDLSPCREGVIWLADRTFEQFINDCERGDWMLWLHNKLRKEDNRSRRLASAHCANTVRHLMKDKRSTDAVDAAILFGEGKITLKELRPFADAAYAAAVAYAAVADAAYADAAYAAYAAVADAARKESQKLTADICRKYLIWN